MALQNGPEPPSTPPPPPKTGQALAELCLGREKAGVWGRRGVGQPRMKALTRMCCGLEQTALMKSFHFVQRSGTGLRIAEGKEGGKT